MAEVSEGHRVTIMVEFKPISLSPSSSQTSQEETPAPAIPREARGPTNPRRAPSISRCIHEVPLSKPCEGRQVAVSFLPQREHKGRLQRAFRATVRIGSSSRPRALLCLIERGCFGGVLDERTLLRRARLLRRGLR